MSQLHDVTFFQPGKIVFHLDGSANAESIQALIDWANSKAPEGVQILPAAQIQFPPQNQHTPGLKKAAFVSRAPSQTMTYMPQSEVEQGPFTLVSAEVTGFSKLEEKEKLLDLILQLDKLRKDAPGNALQVVSPDWLMSGGPSDPGGTGGPGGKPDEYLGPANTREHLFHFESFKPAARNFLENGQEGNGVIVAVLDTAPTTDLDSIYDQWVTRATPKHSLLERMQNNRSLQIVPDPTVDIPLPDVGPIPPNYLRTDDHDYIMADHGLFVAGIIHSLAPKAKILLFQVLNRYGVGDLMSIARGLEKVVTLRQSNPAQNILVNMSLTMQFPLEKAHITTTDPKGRALGKKILSQKRSLIMELLCFLFNLLCKIIYALFHQRIQGCEPSWFERQAIPLLSILRSVNTLRSDIIAAAGNKRRGSYRPRAEFPAAFPDVLGVGALPKSQTPPSNPRAQLDTASYSNFSDRPRGSGMATLGGEKGKGKGVLGIYVGDFPLQAGMTTPPIPNGNGWAWWCGTSFATAVMTGLTANMLSNMPGLTPRDAINELSRAQEYSTKEFEDVLFVTQC